MPAQTSRTTSMGHATILGEVITDAWASLTRGASRWLIGSPYIYVLAALGFTAFSSATALLTASAAASASLTRTALFKIGLTRPRSSLTGCCLALTAYVFLGMPTSHVDLFPEHVFLPGDPISEESGLREARTHLTLHAIMLRAHSMAKESWGDCKPSTGGWGNCKASLEQSIASTGQSRPSMGPRRATCAECAPSTDGIPRTRPTMGTRRLSVGSRRPTMGGRKSSTSSYPTNGSSYPLNEIHEKIARWGVKTHLRDEDEAALPLLPSPEAFGENLDPFDVAFGAVGGNKSSEAGAALKSSKEASNPFEEGATDTDSTRDASETDSSAFSDGSTSRESSPPPLYTSRRPWWKRVISCEALMHRRLRYNQL